MVLKHIHDAMRLTVESAFYQNNVQCIETLPEMYHYALEAMDTIALDQEVHQPERIGLLQGTRILVQNHGSIVGRTAKARHIINEENGMDFVTLIQDVIADNSKREFIRVDVSVGLDQPFVLNGSLMIPETAANNAYNFLLNFKPGLESDASGHLFLYADPDWSSDVYPDGLVVFDAEADVAVILGLKYFGEIKKALLSLAWNRAHKRGFVACHGGVKSLNDTVIAAFGLSGSGKSTITLHPHKASDNVHVLHDDAFVITDDFNKMIALEPSYFDKTSAMDGEKDSTYILTAQNNAVTLNENGTRVLVLGDRRNPNGRCIKSYLSTETRVNSIAQPLDALVWIMKDNCLPPLIKIQDPIMGAVMGATLMTIRSTAENSTEVGKTVIEPYANPFRIYPLSEDYDRFKQLLSTQGIPCYILNTGFFLGKKIKPELSLSLIESIASGTLELNPFIDGSVFEYARIPGYEPDLQDESYQKMLHDSLRIRYDYVCRLPECDALPQEALDAFKACL